MPDPVRAVVTGGPGAGKSSLLEELARRGVRTEREVARALLREPGGMDLRARDPAGFAQAMFDAERAVYDSVAGIGGAVLFDRGFPDIAGFLLLEGLPIPSGLDRACRELRYDGPVFRAPPWREIYRPDDERIQDWHAACASDEAVSRAWVDYGYELVDLPLDPVAARADYVLEMLRKG